MIPRITHSRSQLKSHLNEYDDGAQSLFVSSDTYPDLFSFHFPQIVAKLGNDLRKMKRKEIGVGIRGYEQRLGSIVIFIEVGF
ncbi:hypothetical protein B4Q13_20945 [Lacticaseibacillus rhamnosus]